MAGRIIIALVSALALVVVEPPFARAHRLEADYRVLPDGRIQVEGWFDRGGTPCGAAVQIQTASGQILSQGNLDDRGLCTLARPAAQAFRIVVSAAGGHRKEIDVAQKPGTITAESSPPQESQPFADRSPRTGWREIALGLGFIFALAAFALAWRNSIRLRALERSLDTSRPDQTTRDTVPHNAGR